MPDSSSISNNEEEETTLNTETTLNSEVADVSEAMEVDSNTQRVVTATSAVSSSSHKISIQDLNNNGEDEAEEEVDEKEHEEPSGKRLESITIH